MDSSLSLRLMVLFLAMTLLATGSRAASALLFPEPSGQYNVVLQSGELVDNSRTDPWNPSQPRRIVVSRFDPVSWEQCNATCPVQYMPMIVASTQDEILSTYLESASVAWPSGIFAQLELQVCCSVGLVPDITSRGAFPIILLGPALNTTRLLYSYLALQLSSTGYTVFTLDAPGETSIVQFPDGSVVVGGNVLYNTSSATALYHAQDVRTDDASFVLTTLGVPYVTQTTNASLARAGYVGHAFGGSAAAAAMVNDSRIVGGIDLDGALWGAVLGAGLGRPNANQSFLLWGAEGRNSTTIPSWATFLATVAKWDPTQRIGELELSGSVIGTFTDLGVIADLAGLRCNHGLVRLLFGTIAGSRFVKILQAYADAFFGMSLVGEGSSLLSGPSSSYPEVEFDALQPPS